MWIKIWKTRALLIFIQLFALIVVLLIGKTQWLDNKSNSADATWSQITNTQLQLEKKQTDKFQQIPSNSINTTKAELNLNYRPKYEIAWAHPSNYGERFSQDISGVPISNQPIIVLHETVNSASSAINFFQTPHADENKQASYHTLIKLDGTILYIIPPEKRAFGAANSVFDGPNGPETVKTHPKFPPSVNNFAYHTAFETPLDGRNHAQIHSGYTDAQYHSLAWLIAQSNVPDNRITTHQAVDRSGNRIDPRNFDFKRFLKLLHSYRQLNIEKT